MPPAFSNLPRVRTPSGIYPRTGFGSRASAVMQAMVNWIYFFKGPDLGRIFVRLRVEDQLLRIVPGGLVTPVPAVVEELDRDDCAAPRVHPGGVGREQQGSRALLVRHLDQPAAASDRNSNRHFGYGNYTRGSLASASTEPYAAGEAAFSRACNSTTCR